VTFRFAIEPLSDAHDRKTFTCGVGPLDRYFREQVTQDIRRRVTACQVAVEASSGHVAGYYTIASASIALEDIAPNLAKKLPRYPQVPAVRVGRLAVALAYREIKLGSALLWDAIARAIQSDIAAFALLVDAKDDAAIAFYRHHGLTPFARAPNSLYMPLAEAEKRLRG
jgi:ribosomal protein S18 acetylase RimI-like enzyme